MSFALAPRNAVKAVVVVGALAALAMTLLAVSGPSVGGMQFPDAGVPNLVAQFGVSSGAALSIANALNSWWATALSLVLVPLGLGAAALTIRATWASLVATIGKEAAKKAIQRF